MRHHHTKADHQPGRAADGRGLDGQRSLLDDLGRPPRGQHGVELHPQFKAALAGWHAPTQNFVYADTAGNIGVIAPGYYPQVPAPREPWRPMTGTGACDISGVIPYPAVPQAYDPPSHLIVTDMQAPGQAGDDLFTSGPRLTSTTPATVPARRPAASRWPSR